MTATQTSQEATRVLLAPEDLVGFEINGLYTLNALIGEGGMGVVYLTEQKSIGREVALKLIKPGGLQGTKRLERFIRETSIIASLSHPNIVRVFDSGVAEDLGLHFIAMELIKGIPLQAIVNTHRLNAELSLEIIYQMCGALSEPHERNIIHRDIKPENTILMAMADETIQIKVLDFGIARSHEGDGRITTTGVVMGTPRYMAPETVQGGDIGPQTDLYALGIMLYEMLEGHTPFGGPTPMATMIQHVTEPAPKIDVSPGGFAYPEIASLVDRLLAKDPQDRPSSAPAVRKEIDAIRDKYGFGRVRVDPNARPVDALAPYLVERDESHDMLPRSHGTNSWDEADSYELTQPVSDASVDREDSQERSADNLLPIPVTTARRHLESRGRPMVDFPTMTVETDAVDFDAPSVESSSKAPTSEMLTDDVQAVAQPPNRGLMIFVTVAIVVLLGVLIWTQNSPPTVHQINTEAPSTVSKPEAIEPALPVAEPAQIAETEDMGPDQGAPGTNPAKLGEPPVEPSAAPKTKPKADPAQKKPAKKTDDFEKGMEWLKPQ